MKYKTYGKTGKDISRIAAGCMRLKTPQSDKDIAEAADVLVHAYEKGINYFDTAPFYCGDRSEEIVGRAIQSMKPGTYYVSSKCAKAEGPEFRASLERSLKRLGLDRIHFFHIWCLVRPEEWEEREKGGAVEAAVRAKEEGLIEHLVFSTHMTGQETAGVIEKGLFEGVTLGYNAINFPYREEAVCAAGKAGIGLVTMNPLAGGLIPQHAERFSFLCRESDPDTVTAALRFNLSHQAITAALVGFSNKKEVDQAVAALDGFTPVSDDELSEIRKHIVESFDALCTGCGYCLPCPAGVPIPKYLDAYNMREIQGTDDAVLERLKWHWDITPAGAKDCVGCGQCEKACTQHLPIIERLEGIARLKAEGQKNPAE